MLLLVTACIETVTSASHPQHQNLYKTLGLSSDCSSSDIKKAYRKLALKYHPDKAKRSERDAAEAKFKEILRAYEVLSDDSKRKLYDQYGDAGVDQNFNPQFGEFDNFLPPLWIFVIFQRDVPSLLQCLGFICGAD